MCGAAALVYAIDCSCCRTIALAFVRKLQELRTSICTLPRMAKTVRQLAFHFLAHVWARIELQKLVAQFVQTGKVVHAFCVDGKRRSIWDSEENFSLELIADLLRLWSGVKSKKAHVHVMEMVMLPDKKEKNNVLEVTELELDIRAWEHHLEL